MKRKNLFNCLTLMLVICGSFFNSISAQHMHNMAHSESKNPYFVMMNTMMEKMAAAPVGASDAEYYINQMIPHHQCAIDMAKYEIANGKNSEMIQLAKSILAEQQSEIIQLEIIRKGLKNQSPITASFKSSVDMAMDAMMKTMPAEQPDRGSDRMFAEVMLPHHQAAIDMSKEMFANAGDSQLLAFVKMLISNEQIDIDQMKSYLK